MSTPVRNVRLIANTADTLNRFVYESGEIFWDRTNKTLRIFDGSSIGGTILATRDYVLSNGGGGGSGSGTVNTGTANKLAYYAANGTAVSPTTGLTWNGTVLGVTGNITLNGNSLVTGIVAGTGISVSAATGSVIISSTVVASRSYSTISVAGQSNLVAPTSASTLNIVAGANMTISVNSNTNTISFASSGTGGGGGGSGTVSTGAANRLGYYSTSGTTISDTGSGLTWNGSTLSVTGTVTATNFTGTASSATRLTTARSINGVPFDGTSDISITAVSSASALTGNTLASGVTISSLTSVGTLSTLTVSGNITGGNFISTATGTPTITSASDIQINPTGNVVMGGPTVLKNYTLTQLASVVPATGAIAYCTNMTGGAGVVYYTGSAWKRVKDDTVAN
jgi:hypothetical protein